ADAVSHLFSVEMSRGNRDNVRSISVAAAGIASNDPKIVEVALGGDPLHVVRPMFLTKITSFPPSSSQLTRTSLSHPECRVGTAGAQPAMKTAAPEPAAVRPRLRRGG